MNGTADADGRFRPQAIVPFTGTRRDIQLLCRLLTDGSVEEECPNCAFGLLNVDGAWNPSSCISGLQERYGGKKIQYAGTYDVSPVVKLLNESWYRKDYGTLGGKYPALTNEHAIQMYRQAAVCLSAIALANAESVHRVALNYSKSDAGCTGQAFYISAISDIASQYAVNVIAPLWRENANDPHEGIGIAFHALDEIAQRHAPHVETMSERQACDAKRHFNAEILPNAEPVIEKLAAVFKKLNLRRS